MTRPILLDLFCGAGGCSVGYHRAGFDVVGVDIKPQPRYPFPFVQMDATEALERMGRSGWYIECESEDRIWFGDDFAAIHASPPCQRYSRAAFTGKSRDKHPDLLASTRSLLVATGKPYVIENVDGAPVSNAVQLCGLMFGLKVFRHRWFESSTLIMIPPHPSHRGKKIGNDGMCCVVGHGGGVSRRMREHIASLRRDGAGGQQNKSEWMAAMGIDWMTRNELSQAIPPAYTEHVGRQLIRVVASLAS